MRGPVLADPASDGIETRLPVMDGARALACLVVLLVHAAAMTFPSLGTGLAGVGKFGVWLFFVLSAFLLTFQLQQRGFALPVLGDYAVGRILRILPVFVIGVIFYRIAGTAGITNDAQMWDALLFKQGFAHLWTIPVEFKTYLIIPPLALAFGFLFRRFGTWGVVLCALAMLVAHQMLFPFWKTPVNSVEAVWYFPVFLMGAAAVNLRPTISTGLTKTSANLIVPATMVALVLSIPAISTRLIPGLPSDYLMDQFIPIGAAWTLILLCWTVPGATTGWLKSKAMAQIGRASFSIYIYHWFVAKTLAAWMPQSVFAVVLIVVFSLVIGMIMERIIERPMELLRKQIRHRVLMRA